MSLKTTIRKKYKGRPITSGHAAITNCCLIRIEKNYCIKCIQIYNIQRKGSLVIQSLNTNEQLARLCHNDLVVQTRQREVKLNRKAPKMPEGKLEIGVSNTNKEYFYSIKMEAIKIARHKMSLKTTIRKKYKGRPITSGHAVIAYCCLIRVEKSYCIKCIQIYNIQLKVSQNH